MPSWCDQLFCVYVCERKLKLESKFCVLWNRFVFVCKIRRMRIFCLFLSYGENEAMFNGTSNRAKSTPTMCSIDVRK